MRRNDAARSPLLEDCQPCARCALALARWPSTTPRRFEIDFRLRLKEKQFEEAAMLASGVRIEALADDGLVVPGQNAEGESSSWRIAARQMSRSSR